MPLNKIIVADNQQLRIVGVENPVSLNDIIRWLLPYMNDSGIKLLRFDLGIGNVGVFCLDEPTEKQPLTIVTDDQQYIHGVAVILRAVTKKSTVTFHPLTSRGLNYCIENFNFNVPGMTQSKVKTFLEGHLG